MMKKKFLITPQLKSHRPLCRFQFVKQILTSFCLVLIHSNILAMTFSNGDIFIATESGIIKWYGPPPAYTLKGTFSSGVGNPCGMRVNPVTNELWVTTFSGSIRIFNNDGTFSGSVNVSAFQTTTESIVFDFSGNAYVGGPNGDLVKISPARTILDHYELDREFRDGPDWIDLCSDQRTIYYTSEGSRIKRYDVVTRTQLPDFADLTLNTQRIFAVRVLADCSVLAVTGENVIFRVNPSGVIQSTYVPSNPVGCFSVAISPDANSFFAGGLALYIPYYQFNINNTDVESVISSQGQFPITSSIAVCGDTLHGGSCNEPCNGAPLAGTAIAEYFNLCSGGTVRLTVSGASVAGGIIYQWQMSSDNQVWNDILTANEKFYTIPCPQTPVYYRCILTCVNSAQSSASISVLVTPCPPPFEITADYVSPYCGGDPVTISVTGCTHTLTWYEDNSAGISALPFTGTEIVVYPYEHTQYKVTCCDSIGCCEASVQIFIEPCCTSCDTSNHTDALVLNTGYDTMTNSALGIGMRDNAWKVINAPLSSGLDLTTAAYTITHNTQLTFANSQWISPFYPGNSVAPNPTGDPYTFEYIFCLCANDSVRFSFSSLLDDSIRIYLEDYQYNFIHGPYNSSGGLDFDQTFFLTKGVHHLRVDLRNMSGSQMGFNLSGFITGDHLLAQGSCHSTFLKADAGPDQFIFPGGCATLHTSAPIWNIFDGYTWYDIPGDNGLSINSDLEVCPSENTCYKLVATNEFGCSDTDTVCVNIIVPCDTTICENFESGLNGWHLAPGAAAYELLIETENFNHYLKFTNYNDSLYPISGNNFSGKWCCGALCYDYRIFDDGNYLNLIKEYPVVYIMSGMNGFKFTSNISVSDNSGWQRICAPISDCGFESETGLGRWSSIPGTQPNTASWNNVIQNITGIYFEVQDNLNPSDGFGISGFDNVCFTAFEKHISIQASPCKDSLCIKADGCCDNQFTYLWSDGRTTECISGITEGNVYSATATDTAGNIYFASITAPARLHIECFDGSINNCFGPFPTGSISVTALGGTGTKSITIRRNGTGGPVVGFNSSALDQSYIFNGLSPGHYCAYVVDEYGCEDSCCCDIVQYTLAFDGTVFTNPTCIGSSDGDATIYPIGGKPPYDYQWSNGFTTAAITGIPAGPYPVTVTDSLGCTISDTIILTDPPPIIFNSILPDYGCPGAVVSIFGSNLSGIVDALFNGESAGSISVIDDTQVDAVVPPGATSGNIVIVSSNGCTETSTYPFTVNTCSEVFLNLKLFLQGYYLNAGSASPMDNFGNGGSLYINGLIDGFSADYNDVDSIFVSLVDPTFFTSFATASGKLQTDGSLTVLFSDASLNNSYYLKVNHRNHLETWSAEPVLIASVTTYDFTDSYLKAYEFGGNPFHAMFEIEPGVWAIYSGDIHKDEFIDILDIPVLTSQVEGIFPYGYQSGDLNGDGFIDILDIPLLTVNIEYWGGIYSQHP